MVGRDAVFLFDAVAQMDALICYASHYSHDPSQKLPLPNDEAARGHLQQAQQLTEEEAWACLRQMQLWLASFPPEQASYICKKLVDIAVFFQHAQAMPPTLQDMFKAVPTASGNSATSRLRGSFSSMAGVAFASRLTTPSLQPPARRFRALSGDGFSSGATQPPTQRDRVR